MKSVCKTHLYLEGDCCEVNCPFIRKNNAANDKIQAFKQ
jgi:hypothetical protein